MAGPVAHTPLPTRGQEHTCATHIVRTCDGPACVRSLGAEMCDRSPFGEAGPAWCEPGCTGVRGGHNPRSLAVWLAVDHSGPQFPDLYSGVMTAFLSSEVLRGSVGRCLQALWVAPVCTTGWVRAALSSLPAAFWNADPASRPARGKSTGCARAGGVSYKTKGNLVLRGDAGQHRSYCSCQDPNPQAQIRVLTHSAQFLSTLEG